MDDKRIIELYFARKEDAIKETERKYGNYCFLIAHNILSSREDAEECLNDAYLKLWNSIPPNRPDPLKTYLGKIVRNISINRYVSKHAQKRDGETEHLLEEVCEFIPDQTSLTPISDQFALKQAINSFMASLPKKARIIFVKRYWYAISLSGIARDIGASENYVKVSLHRTRSALKTYLEKEGIDL